MRKPIGMTCEQDIILVVCDDGTIWRCDIDKNKNMIPVCIGAIPQK